MAFMGTTSERQLLLKTFASVRNILPMIYIKYMKVILIGERQAIVFNINRTNLLLLSDQVILLACLCCVIGVICDRYLRRQ